MTEQALPKRILVVSFSQSGQLDRVLDSLAAPLRSAERLVVERVLLKSWPAYSFPWIFWRFQDAFPESVLLDPPALDESAFPVSQNYYSTIIDWTIWYLSKSIRVTAFSTTSCSPTPGPFLATFITTPSWLVRSLSKSRHARLRAHLEEPSGSSPSRSPCP